MARLDDAGQAKSRGVGFVEFAEHEHALACLRQLNNNPSVVSATRRPVVEFAVESVKIVKARERAARLQTERARRHSEAEGDDDAAGARACTALSSKAGLLIRCVWLGGMQHA